MNNVRYFANRLVEIPKEWTEYISTTVLMKLWKHFFFIILKKKITFSASTSLPLEIKYFGLSGRNANAIVTKKAGIPQTATKILHELNLKPSWGLRPMSSNGIIAQAGKKINIFTSYFRQDWPNFVVLRATNAFGALI